MAQKKQDMSQSGDWLQVFVWGGPGNQRQPYFRELQEISFWMVSSAHHTVHREGQLCLFPLGIQMSSFVYVACLGTIFSLTQVGLLQDHYLRA